jgi:uncharacterized protein (DUF1800 family)
MSAPDRDPKAAIAATRFGLGARPGEIAEAARDPQGWLKGQIRRGGADLPKADGETAAQRIADLRDLREQRRELKQEAVGGDPSGPARDPVKVAQKMLREDTAEDFLARARLGATTEAPFRERWALFFANHFTVAGNKLQTAMVVGPFEAEAIRPHVFGRFEDLLIAAETHPVRRACPASTRTSLARSWSCTPSASMAATPRPTSPSSPAP